jgi:hypothetical protein
MGEEAREGLGRYERTKCLWFRRGNKVPKPWEEGEDMLYIWDVTS